ncbi:hypothetical protein ANO11243_092170 [Dothideomycetidae sp. 11243]|nr:hypothetical protein ANO11243_092170 [fungal sp. No.11243]
MAPNHLYQYSIMNALMAGIADGGITVGEYVKKGNQGVGTFVEMKGELILIDGEVYRMKSDGTTDKAAAHEQLPYAVATHFEPQRTIRQGLTSKAGVEAVLRQHSGKAGNLFISFRITGRFSKMRCRSVGGQMYPHQPLSEVGETQTERTFHDIEGVIVGIRSPKSWQGVSVAGEHMHFIDNDRNKGGHVLELCADGEVEFGLAVISHLHVELPTSDGFNEAGLATDDSGLHKVEG